MTLEEIFDEGITETVVTTLSSEGIPNAAPMGVVRHGDQYIIRMFPDTRTYRNVKETGCLVACITTDPMIYVISAFEDLNCSFFTQVEGMPPIVRDTYAWAYFRARPDGVVKLIPDRSEIVKRAVPKFSRGFASVIDATITGTRLRFLGDEGKKRIKEDASVVLKCGNQRDLEAMKKLQEILGL